MVEPKKAKKKPAKTTPKKETLKVSEVAEEVDPNAEPLSDADFGTLEFVLQDSKDGEVESLGGKNYTKKDGKIINVDSGNPVVKASKAAPKKAAPKKAATTSSEEITVGKSVYVLSPDGTITNKRAEGNIA